MLPVLVLVAIGAAAIAGFVFVTRDDGSGNAAADGPGAVVVQWATLMSQQDYAGACKVMTAEAVELVEPLGQTCAEGVEALDIDGLYADGDETKVIDEAIDGDIAEVTVDFGGTALGTQVVTAAKEGGVWKISPFATGEAGVATTEIAPGTPKGDIGGAGDVECQTEVELVETAVAAYEAQFGELPADTQALVDRGILRERPKNVTIGPDGAVVPAGDCA